MREREGWGTVEWELRKLVTGEAEAVVGVVELGWDAGAGGAFRDFDVVAPGASAGGAAGARSGAGGILFGGVSIVVGREPVAAPLVNVLAQFVEAIDVGRRLADGFGSGEPAFGVLRAGLGRLIAPGVESVFDSG